MNNHLKKIAVFALMTGLGVHSSYGQAGGPVPPCEQYTVVGAAYTCPTTSTTGSLLNSACSPLSGSVTYLPNVLCVKVIPPSLATGWQTWFEVTKRDGTSFSSGGRIIVNIPYEGLSQCFTFSAGGTKKIIKLDYAGFPENNPFNVYLESNSNDKFYAGSVTTHNNPRVCKIAPFNGETGVSVSPTLSYNTLNVLGSNLWKYALKYRKLGEATWSYTAFTSNASANLSNLPQGTTYEWTVISRWGSSNTLYEGEIFQFTTTAPPPPPPCYPDVAYHEPWEWNATTAIYKVENCADLYDRIENIDDPAWVTGVNYNTTTQEVEISMQPNNTLNERFASFRFVTTEGRGFTWQVVQRAMNYADIIIEPDGNSTTICSPSWLQTIKSNCVLNNDYYITVFANTEEEPQGVQIGQMLAGDALANGMQLELPANSQRFSNIKKMRFVLQANYGGYPAGSYLQTSESDYFFAGVPHPVLSHQTTLEACENGTYQCRFLSVNNAGNFKYRVSDTKGVVIAETTEYFTVPVGTDAMDLLVETIDTDCNTRSQPYSFTITPIAKPVVEMTVNGSQHIVNQPITVNFSANQPQHTNTPPMVYVRFNNGAFNEISPAIVNGAFSYTPTQTGSYVFRIQYRGNLGCWGDALSDEITVDNLVVLPTGDVYVNSTTGNDTSGDGSLINPYKTLAKGLSVITTGSALHFSGDFNEEATITKNITLIGDGENTSSIATLRIVAGQEVSVLGNFGITDKLEVENGALLSCIGNSIWLKSSATKTATAQIEGTLDGAIAAERWLATPYSGALFGSPMADQNLADLPLASPPKQFNENSVTTSLNNGYLTTTDVIAAVAKGYRVVYLAGTQKVVVWGTPNNDPNYTQIISRTHTGVGSAGGYNLIANSYLMPLDFVSLAQSNAGQINGIAYFFEGTSPTAGIFRTYNANTGVSTGGATKVVSTFQAFFIRRTVVGTSNFVIGKNNWLATASNNSQYFRAENLAKPQMDLLRVLVKSGKDSSDVAVHTLKGTSANYDAGLDQELPNVDELVASNLVWMHEKESGENLLVNAIGEKLEGEFSLSIHTQGKSSISINEKRGNVKVALYDKKTGRKIDLAVPYEFESFGNQTDRFVLLLGETVDNYIGENELFIYPNPAKEQITVGSNQFTVLGLEVVDMLGWSLEISSQNNINVKNLSNGTYILKITTEGNGVISKKFVKD